MATYEPFEYQRAATPKYDSYEGAYRVGNRYEPNLNQWNQEQNQAQQNAFQGYAGDQFKGLFDMVNAIPKNPNPLSGFSHAPRYNPYGGSRADFTSGGNPMTAHREVDDMHGGTEMQSYQTTSPVNFDQQGYLDARFGNINSYLSSLGSFLGNIGMGGSDAGVAQAAAQRAMHRASMPTIGMSQPMGTPQMGGNPALSGFGGGAGRLVGKGWGSHPSFKGLLAGGGE